jgi:hypothetical protein
MALGHSLSFRLLDNADAADYISLFIYRISFSMIYWLASYQPSIYVGPDDAAAHFGFNCTSRII